MLFDDEIINEINKIYKKCIRKKIREIAKHNTLDIKKLESYFFKTNIKKRRQIILPFIGIINKNNCFAIKYSGGLHTQCCLNHTIDSVYCEKHDNEAQKNANKKPNIGDIRDRLKCNILEYIDEKKRRTKSYMEYIIQQNFNKQDCIEAAKVAGIVIPEIHWKERIKKRGRPRKNIIAVDDTDSEEEDDVVDRIRLFIKEDNKIINHKSSSTDKVDVLYDTPRGYMDMKTGFIYCKKTGKLLAL